MLSRCGRRRSSSGWARRLDAPADAARTLLDEALGDGRTVAVVGRRSWPPSTAGPADPVVTALGRPVRAFSAEELAARRRAEPERVVAAEVGTPSVAEAAALLAAGPGAELVVAKQKGATATVAVARRRRPEGGVVVVGLGPGHASHRTPAAATAVRQADVVIGYELYVDQCADLLAPAADRGAQPDRGRSRPLRGGTPARGSRGAGRARVLRRPGRVRHGDARARVGSAVRCARGRCRARHHCRFGRGGAARCPARPRPRVHQPVRLAHAVGDDRAAAARRGGRRSCRGAVQRPIEPAHVAARCRPHDSADSARSRHTCRRGDRRGPRPDERIVRTTLGALDTDLVGMRSIVLVGSSTTTVIGDAAGDTAGIRPGPMTVHPIEVESYRILHERVDLSRVARGCAGGRGAGHPRHR